MEKLPPTIILFIVVLFEHERHHCHFTFGLLWVVWIYQVGLIILYLDMCILCWKRLSEIPNTQINKIEIKIVLYSQVGRLLAVIPHTWLLFSLSFASIFFNSHNFLFFFYFYHEEIAKNTFSSIYFLNILHPSNISRYLWFWV